MKRRHFLKKSALSLLALPAVGSAFYARTLRAAATKPSPGRAKTVIQIWMWGGPSQLDTFDPKPDAGKEYCGDLDKPIDTNVPGVRISQTLPKLAAHADKYAIIRTTSHHSNHHETAAYMMQTGREPGQGLVYPNIGAVIARIKGEEHRAQSELPPYVVLTTSQGRFSESGFLGSKYKPFVTGGDPAARQFLVSGYVVQGITPERQQVRRQMLETLDTLGSVGKENEILSGIARADETAWGLILGDAVKVFDLSTEPQEIREKYGMNWFGQSCLVARRLAQEGVPYVTINYRGWDTHKRHFETLAKRQPEWDTGLATLLEDLAERGLLDRTVIWWGGEFGRTPKVDMASPWYGGRGHHGRCFSTVLAGGGFKGGKVIGVSDEKGDKVLERPVAPQDLLGSIYDRMGINPDAPMPNERGLNVPIMPPPSKAGRLTELMT